MEQLARRRLEQCRGKNIERAESDPDLAQEGSHFLGQVLDPRLLAGNIAMPGDEIEQQRARLRSPLRTPLPFFLSPPNSSPSSPRFGGDFIKDFLSSFARELGEPFFSSSLAAVTFFSQ